MEYLISIDGFSSTLSEEVSKVTFESKIPESSDARSLDLDTTVTIAGRISFDADKLFMSDSTKELAQWSLIPPSVLECYKKVTIEYTHAGAPRKYTLSHAFVVMYSETFTLSEGLFTLVIRQKSDRVDGISVE